MRKIIIPLGFVLLNFVLKALFLDSRSIWGDEAFSVFHAQMDIPAIITQLSQGNNPPLFEIMLHYWIGWFGISPFSVRFLPLVFSSLTVMFIYLIGLRFFNFRTAIVASLIFTFSTYQVSFSHEARVYSFFALCTTISMYAFLCLIKGHRTGSYFILLVLSNTLLAYSHFLGLMVPAIQVFCCVIFENLRKEKLLLTGSAVLVSVCAYIPYLKVFITRFRISVHSGTWLRPIDIDQLYNSIWSFSNQPIPAVIFLGALMAGTLMLIKRKYEYISIYAKITVVWFVAPFLLMFLVSYKYFPFTTPIFQDRYLIFISIAFDLVIAITFDYISNGSILRWALIPLPVMLMFTTCRLDPDNKMHTADAVRKVRELKTKNTVVYICPAYYSLSFVYYYDPGYFKEYDTDTICRKVLRSLSKEHIYAINTDQKIDSAISADQIIYYGMLPDAHAPDNNIYNYLLSHYTLTARYSYPLAYSVLIFKKH